MRLPTVRSCALMLAICRVVVARASARSRPRRSARASVSRSWAEVNELGDVLQVLAALGDVAELGERGQRLVEPLGGDAQLERRLAAVGVAGADLRARDDAAEAADGRDDRVGRRLEPAVRRLDDEHGDALDLARRSGSDRQRAAAGGAARATGGLGGGGSRAALRRGRLVGLAAAGLSVAESAATPAEGAPGTAASGAPVSAAVGSQRAGGSRCRRRARRRAPRAPRRATRRPAGATSGGLATSGAR